jgi:hypothetical protein
MEIRCEPACRDGKQGVAGKKYVLAAFINTHIILLFLHLFTHALPLRRILGKKNKNGS